MDLFGAKKRWVFIKVLHHINIKRTFESVIYFNQKLQRNSYDKKAKWPTCCIFNKPLTKNFFQRNLFAKHTIFLKCDFWNFNSFFFQIQSDQFCWACHGIEPTLFCSACLRSFHTSPKCSESKKLTAEQMTLWKCPVCIMIEKDELQTTEKWVQKIKLWK